MATEAVSNQTTQIESTESLEDFKLFVSKRKRKESNNLEMEQEDDGMAEGEVDEDMTKKLKFPPVSGEKTSASLFIFAINSLLKNFFSKL